MSRGTVNKVILIGRVGKDPELRYAPSGVAVASYSLATNSRQKSDDGSWEDLTEWHSIKSFGKNAEFTGEYVKKGTLLFVEGRIQTNSWEDQQGQKRYRTEIICSASQLLGSKSDDGNNHSQNENIEKTDTVEKTNNSNKEDDDLPF
jgi:single-strand DNA-binding protein